MSKEVVNNAPVLLDDKGKRIFFDIDLVLSSMEKLISLTKELGILIKKGDINDIDALIEETDDIVHYLYNQQKTLKLHSHIIKHSLNFEQKTLLANFSKNLVEYVNDNCDKAKKSVYVNQEILKIIAKVVRNNSSKFSNYASNGEMKASDTIAITINNEV